MPRVGFGTAGLGDQTARAVTWALEAGYRLIDSAQVIDNQLGQMLEKNVQPIQSVGECK